MMPRDDDAPTLEEQMAAQARLREKAGMVNDENKVALGCLSITGLVALSLFLGAAFAGGYVAWWIWLTW